MLFKNEVIDYTFFNNRKSNTILFLHGWGGNKFSFLQIMNLFKFNYNIISVTLPTNQPTTISWDLFDYATVVSNLLELISIKDVHIICHSFGFRVALILKKTVTVKSIIVTGGAGIKSKKNLSFLKKINKNHIKIKLKSTKNEKLFEKIASKDYLELTTTNRISFKNIVNLDLSFFLKFNCPMLLFWGKYDSSTPLSFAKKISKINKCQLEVVKSDHFAYLKESSLFNHLSLEFLRLNST